MSSNLNASSATIVAVAVFEQDRKAEGSTLFFDAQIYLGPDCPVLIAAMRFFNHENLAFDEVGFYMVIARVCKQFLTINHTAFHSTTLISQGGSDGVRSAHYDA